MSKYKPIPMNPKVKAIREILLKHYPDGTILQGCAEEIAAMKLPVVPPVEPESSDENHPS